MSTQPSDDPPIPPGPAPDAGDALPFADAPEPSRFCGVCGAPLPPDGAPCSCAARTAIPDAELLATGKRERRSIWSAVALYGVLLSTMLVGALFMDPDDSSSVTQGENIIMLLHACIVLVWCALDREHTFAGLRKLPRPRWLALAILLPICTFTIAYLLIRGLSSVFDVPEYSYSADYLDQGYGWWFVILAVCVEPALVEELAFRGVILGAARRVFGVKEAVAVSSLLFMMLHLSPLSFPHLFLIGLALGYLRVASGSLYPCMLAHFVHNSLVILAEYLGY